MYKTVDLCNSFLEIRKEEIKWKKIKEKGLDVDYGIILKKLVAQELLEQLQRTIEYYEENLTKVRIYGRWYPIPRQQVAYGDEGLEYRFSGISVPAKPWTPILTTLKELVEKITGYKYNFVLINRYRNGNDHMGEHKDDESDLDINTPIASLSLGQNRDFIFKHGDRKRKIGSANILPVKLCLEHGSLLLMNHPTNKYWYHSLPPRKKLLGERINLTFRKIVNKKP